MSAETRPPAAPTWEYLAEPVVQGVADRHGLDVAELLSQSRDPRRVRARHEAAFLLAEIFQPRLAQIARALGMVDHTSARYAIRNHARHAGLPIPDLLKHYSARRRASLYSARGRAAIALLRSGARPPEIAALVGLNKSYCYRLAQKVRKGELDEE